MNTVILKTMTKSVPQTSEGGIGRWKRDRIALVSRDSLYAPGQLVEVLASKAEDGGHLLVKTGRGEVYSLPKDFLDKAPTEASAAT